MAEVDLNSVASSGVDPVTGSPLSREVRQAIFNRTRVSSSAFTSESKLISQYNQSNSKNLELIETNRQSLISLDSQIQNLNQQIVNLNSGLDKISVLLQEDGAADRRKINTDLERERRYAEQEIRIGKENEIEGKIQSAVLLPVQKIAPKVQSIFEGTKTALLFLFSGWLTNELVKLFDANQKNDTNKLTEIKNNILKHLGIAGGILLLINGGFVAIISTMGRVIGKVSSLIGKIITAPFRATAKAAETVFKGPKSTPKAPRTASPNIGSKIASGAKSVVTSVAKVGGVALTGVAAVSEFVGRKSEGQTNIEAIAGTGGSLSGSSLAASTVSKLPLPPLVKFPLAIGAGVAGWWAGGKGADVLTGADKPETSKEVKSSPEMMNKTPPNTNKEISTQPIIPTMPLMMSNSSKDSQTSLTSSNTTSDVKPKESLATGNVSMMFGVDKSNEFGESFKNLEKSFSSENKNLTPEITQENKNFTQSFFDNQKQDIKKSSIDMDSMINIAPSEINNVPREIPNVGNLPEPKPNIIMAQNSQQKNQSPMQASSQSNDSVTDVPLIESSNPDNFYILYSRLSYNVVI